MKTTIAYGCWAAIAFALVVVTVKTIPLLIALHLP